MIKDRLLMLVTVPFLGILSVVNFTKVPEMSRFFAARFPAGARTQVRAHSGDLPIAPESGGAGPGRRNLYARQPECPGGDRSWGIWNGKSQQEMIRNG